MRSKAAGVVVAAAYKQATQDLAGFDEVGWQAEESGSQRMWAAADRLSRGGCWAQKRHRPACAAASPLWPLPTAQEMMARLLKLTEALLMGGGAACRQVRAGH